MASGHLQRSLIKKLRRSLSTHVGGRVWRDYYAAAMHRLKNSACCLCSATNEISMTKKRYWQINVGLPGRPCKALINRAMSALFSTLGSLLCAVCRPKQNKPWATPSSTSALQPHPVAWIFSPTSVPLASSTTAVVSFEVTSDPGRLHVDFTNVLETTPAQLVTKELELRTHTGCVSSCCTPSHFVLNQGGT